MKLQRGSTMQDGLWRSLCPSFGRCLVKNSPRRATSRPNTIPPPRHRSTQSVTGTAVAFRRMYTTEAKESKESIDTYIKGMFVNTAPPDKEKRTEPSLADMLVRKKPVIYKELARVSLDELFESLEALRGRQKAWKNASKVDRHGRIAHLVEYLIVERKQRLTPFLYECLVDTMSDPQTSGTTVISIIRDMEKQGVESTRELYDVALESFMVHPNYVAMLEILDLMGERRWPPKHQTVAIALLRDEQYELAYDKLVDLHAAKVRVKPWVYDVFVFIFGKLGFLDEMLEILALRLSLKHVHGLDTLQLYAMDVCSAAFHYPGTVAGWNTLVRSGRVYPADGIVENVLDTAARAADTSLAAEALDTLARRMRTRDHHYDSLVDAFTHAGDYSGAVRIYCIMHESGVVVGRDVAEAFFRTAGAGVAGAELNAWIFTAARGSGGGIGSSIGSSSSRGRGRVPPAVVDAALARHVDATDDAALVRLLGEYPRLCGAPCPRVTILSMLRRCTDIACLSELCDRLLEGASGAADDEKAALADQLRGAASELLAADMKMLSQALLDKLAARGLEAVEKDQGPKL